MFSNVGILHQLGQVFSITNQAAGGGLMECVVLAPAGCPVLLGLGAFRWPHAPELGLGTSRPASSHSERCRQVLVCLRADACEFVHVFARVLVRSRGPLAAVDYATSGTQPAHSRCLRRGGAKSQSKWVVLVVWRTNKSTWGDPTWQLTWQKRMSS